MKRTAIYVNVYMSQGLMTSNIPCSARCPGEQPQHLTTGNPSPVAIQYVQIPFGELRILPSKSIMV